MLDDDTDVVTQEWARDESTPADPDTPVEMKFVLAVRDHPDDLGMRMVYADWLEERGLVGKAEVVRLLAEPPAEGTPAMARLRDAVEGLPADWVATISRAPIEKCDVRFQLKCPRSWDALATTDLADVRHCGHCDKQVFFCSSLEDVRDRGHRGQCVAFSPKLVHADALVEYDHDEEMWMGEVAAPDFEIDLDPTR